MKTNKFTGLIYAVLAIITSAVTIIIYFDRLNSSDVVKYTAPTFTIQQGYATFK